MLVLCGCCGGCMCWRDRCGSARSLDGFVQDFRVRFAEMLWEQLREPFPISNPDNPTQLARFAVTNRGAFVITSLVDSSSPEVR